MSEAPNLVVIKRSKKHGGGHHGGAWKIAYADFVTAMMAFFLLLWLLGSLGEFEKKGIADYFNQPLELALTKGSSVSDRSSLIQGGGDDFSTKDGEVKNSKSIETPELDLEEARKELEREEAARLEELKEKIEQEIDANPLLKQFKKQLLLDITSEGLRIQIVDEQNRPMFATGSDDLQTYTKVILKEIGRTLNNVPNRISIAGHTDASVYANDGSGYTNWELSSDRANAARRELVLGSMHNEKILRVVGLSSAVPFDKKDPLNASNRRISIVVLNKKTELSITEENGNNEAIVPNAQGVEQKLLP